ncbi:hypothetical protein MAR_021151 [Mya arenaria]|uniref:Ig-like domain-containing protein n=1 Tax=Mya arenaria TaxID=6604 RepID=A0ABY7E6Z8_MYAAR|nr:hypothetical protein MAR_021151 [Mya arenaria]
MPSTLTSQVFNITGFSTIPINLPDPNEPFYVGQTVKMECSADIGSYNSTVQIRWLKSNIVAANSMGDSSDTEGVNKEDIVCLVGTLQIGTHIYIDDLKKKNLVANKITLITANVPYTYSEPTALCKKSNPVFVRQTAPTYDHLTSREQTEYTEIVLAVNITKAPRMSVFTPEKKPYIQRLEVLFQRTDSPAAGSNYEVPENQESSNEPRDYENETNPKKTQASTYEHFHSDDE